MRVETVYSNEFAPETAVWKFRGDNKQFLHLEIDKDSSLYGITWFTDISTREGLSVIRNSYARLKGVYQETGELKGVGRVWEEFDGGFMLGDVTFALKGYTAPSSDRHTSRTGRTLAVELPYFLNPDSFTSSIGQQNPLLWIRVDTEYLSYYFHGDAFRPVDLSGSCAMDPQSNPSREFGLIGEYNVIDEILRLFKETSSMNLSDRELASVKQKFEVLFGRFPQFNPRKES